jgi:general secretion pathway protein J
MDKQAARCRHAGFTLVELLVAITILAIVAVLGWRGLDGIVRARVALTSDLEQTRGMQLAFAQLQSDCERIASTANLDGHPVLAAQAGRLTLVRSVFADNQPSRLQVVAYRLADGVLSRRESSATRDLRELDQLWNATIGDTDQTQAVVLQSGLSAMGMRLWAADGAGWRDPEAPPPPSSTVAPGAPPPAPSGLEVSLQLQNQQAGLLKVFLLGAI